MRSKHTTAQKYTHKSKNQIDNIQGAAVKPDDLKRTGGQG